MLQKPLFTITETQEYYICLHTFMILKLFMEDEKYILPIWYEEKHICNILFVSVHIAKSP